jgi:hypothetical protein
MKFKVNDKVRIVAADHFQPEEIIGEVTTINQVYEEEDYLGGYYSAFVGEDKWYFAEYELELVEE